MHTALAIEDGAAAVAGLHGNGKLKHFAQLHFTSGGEDTFHHTAGQAHGVAQCDDRFALEQLCGIPEWKRGEVAALDLEDREIPFAVGGVHGKHSQFFAIPSAGLDGACFADDVQARGNQILTDGEPRAGALTCIAAPAVADGDQRFAGLGSQIADGFCRWRFGRSILGKDRGAEDEGEG